MYHFSRKKVPLLYTFYWQMVLPSHTLFRTLHPFNCCKCAVLYRVRTVLKSPWILGEVLEKSLNSIFPWNVLKFLCKSLKSHWISFSSECSGLESVFWCRWVVQDNINHSLENLKVIYIKYSMFYAIINYQFKTSELKNVEKLVKQTVQTLKSYQNRLGMCFFLQFVKLYS